MNKRFDIARKKTNIRHIGLHQPFAEMMLHGKIETRWVRMGFKAPFPLGTYLIYSTGNSYEEAKLRMMCGTEQLARIEATVGDQVLLKRVMICLADLTELVEYTSAMENRGFVKHREDPDHMFRMVGLVFNNIRPLIQKPFLDGKQGIGFVCQDVFDIIEFEDTRIGAHHCDFKHCPEGHKAICEQHGCVNPEGVGN